MKKNKLSSSIALAFAIGLSPITSAYATPSTGGNAYQRAFAAILTNPADPETSFRFVKVAIDAGDYRGAIAALERILKIDPGLSNIRLELGVLYHRVGANELAKGYINQALQDPAVPADVRNRAKAILSRAEEADRKHLFSGNLLANLVFDDNANAGPSDPTLGGTGLVSEDTAASDDTSIELIAALQYAYLLEGQRGNKIEANLLGYNRKYDEFSRLDTLVLDLNIGPRLNFGPLIQPAWNMKPYLSINKTDLEGDDYLEANGFGINFQKPLRLKTVGSLDIQYEDQDYTNSTRRPRVEDRSGSYTKIRGQIRHQYKPRTLVTASLMLGERSSDQDYESMQELGAGVSLRHVYQAFESSQNAPWATTFSLNIRSTSHDEADTANNFTKAREDDRTTLRIATNIPVKPALTGNIAVYYTDNQSNLPIYDYENTGVSLGVSYAF